MFKFYQVIHYMFYKKTPLKNDYHSSDLDAKVYKPLKPA